MKKNYIIPIIEISESRPKYSFLESSGIVGGGSSYVKKNNYDETVQSEEQGWGDELQKSIW